MSKPGPTQSDKFQKKLREVKKRTRELEDENERLVVKVSRGRRSLLRLKAERRFLLERLEEFERLQESDDLESGWGESSVTGNDEVEKVLSHKKPEKQPNTPKRPTNAFLMYCSLQRARDGDKLKDVALSEQTRILGNDWKSLSPDEKKVFIFIFILFYFILFILKKDAFSIFILHFYFYFSIFNSFTKFHFLSFHFISFLFFSCSFSLNNNNNN